MTTAAIYSDDNLSSFPPPYVYTVAACDGVSNKSGQSEPLIVGADLAPLPSTNSPMTK